MKVKNIWYVDDRCVCSFENSNIRISIPICDDPGLCPKDEIIMTNSMIWKLFRYEKIPSFMNDNNSYDSDDLPFPDSF